jgi:hypothetical protein
MTVEFTIMGKVTSANRVTRSFGILKKREDGSMKALARVHPSTEAKRIWPAESDFEIAFAAAVAKVLCVSAYINDSEARAIVAHVLDGFPARAKSRGIGKVEQPLDADDGGHAVWCAARPHDCNCGLQ